MIEILFFAIGAIILAGFFSSVFFDRTKIPDILILMLIGFLLRSGITVIDPSVLLSLAPYVGAIALIMILFDAGLNLNLFKVMKELYEATVFTFLVFLVTCIFVMLLLHLFFHTEILKALVLGAIIGGPCSTIVISIISKLSISEELKILLTLEAVITDALSIIVAITLLQIISLGSQNVQDVANHLLGTFSIAILLAFLLGVLWINVLSRFYDKPFGYLLTIAILLMLYSVIEFSKGSGAIATLVFGLVLGNAKELAKIFSITGNFALEDKIKSFHKEVSFFTRTFFFVYLGFIFDSKSLTLSVLQISIMLVLTILIARILVIKLYGRFYKDLREYGTLIPVLLPRGLAAAVLASLPLASSIGIDFLPEIVVMIIIFTNIITTLGVFFYMRNKGADANETGIDKDKLSSSDMVIVESEQK